LPDYDVLDKILYNHIEKHKSYQELIEMGFNKELITKTLRLVSISEYKRHQTPPILRVSPKAFRTDRQMPVAAKYWK
ncbi:MAG: NAD+ synthase, partial [Bacteroidales bacterium]